MEAGTIEIATGRSTNFTVADHDPECERRIAYWISQYRGLLREKAQFPTEHDRIVATSMARPISSESAYSIYGSLIGTLPMLGIGITKLFSTPPYRFFHVVFGVVLVVSALATGVVGALSGGLARRISKTALPYGIHTRIAFLFVVGLLWGMACGAVGGLFLFIFGAIPLALLGGGVGMLTFPLFHVLHEELSRGHQIELGHVLPIAVGMPLALIAFYLGR